MAELEPGNCPECGATDVNAHAPSCQLGDVATAYAVPPGPDLADVSTRGSRAAEMLDDPLLESIMRDFASAAERACLATATRDPAGAQVHAIEALLCRNLLKRLKEFHREGKRAEVTLDSLMTQHPHKRPVRSPRTVLRGSQ